MSGQRLRRLEVRFGSFTDLTGAAVHAKAWWLRVAGGVKLEGTVQWRSSDLSADQLVQQAPVALQCPAEHFSRPIEGGFIACRLEEFVDLAYPLLLRESGDEVQVGFSSVGPDEDVQREILAAFAQRFVRA